MIKTYNDRYGGVTIDSSALSDNIEDFKTEIEELILSAKNKNLLWIRIPIEKSDFIPILTKLGFDFHHCNTHDLMLIKKINPQSIVPTTKNFTVGVGAIIVRNKKLLVVKDRFSAGYKLPGGHIDINESIKDALKREVYEETGIDIEFESIVNLGHFMQGQFGESNLYIVCTAKALSESISINDSQEIIDAKWIDLCDFLEAESTNIYNKSVVEAFMKNTELKLTAQSIKLRVSGSEVFF